MGASYPHIELSPDGVPYLSGTPIKVVEVVMDRLAYNWDADEIHRQHPSLSLGQIYSALAYYYDNKAEMDRQIGERLRREEEILSKLDTSDLRLKLKLARQAR